jgi:hypothetical protein
VSADSAEQGVQWIDGIHPDLREVITLEECTDIEHSLTHPTSH